MHSTSSVTRSGASGSRPAWTKNRLRRRLIGRLGFERRTQQPVPLEALHQLVGVNDGVGDLAEDICVVLHLRVEVAGDVGQVVERERKLFGQSNQVRIDRGEGGI